MFWAVRVCVCGGVYNANDVFPFRVMVLKEEVRDFSTVEFYIF